MPHPVPTIHHFVAWCYVVNACVKQIDINLRFFWMKLLLYCVLLLAFHNLIFITHTQNCIGVQALECRLQICNSFYYIINYYLIVPSTTLGCQGCTKRSPLLPLESRCSCLIPDNASVTQEASYIVLPRLFSPAKCASFV